MHRIVHLVYTDDAASACCVCLDAAPEPTFSENDPTDSLFTRKKDRTQFEYKFAHLFSQLCNSMLLFAQSVAEDPRTPTNAQLELVIAKYRTPIDIARIVGEKNLFNGPLIVLLDALYLQLAYVVLGTRQVHEAGFTLGADFVKAASPNGRFDPRSPAVNMMRERIAGTNRGLGSNGFVVLVSAINVYEQRVVELANVLAGNATRKNKDVFQRELFPAFAFLPPLAVRIGNKMLVFDPVNPDASIVAARSALENAARVVAKLLPVPVK